MSWIMFVLSSNIDKLLGLRPINVDDAHWRKNMEEHEHIGFAI